MPNNIQNRLVIVGKKEQIDNVLNTIKGDNEVIDFNKIIPMPSELDIPSSSGGEIGLAVIKKKLGVNTNPLDDIFAEKFDEFNEEAKERIINSGLAYVRNLVKYGYPTWFEWNKDNWNTKWNAYDTELKNDNEIWFTTAWQNVSDKIIYKLSTMFPDVRFKYSFSSEDTANNCGKSTFKNGIGVLILIENGSKQALDLYKELHPQYADDYEWVDGEIMGRWRDKKMMNKLYE